MDNLFTGTLTRLVALDPETIGETFSKWSRDSEFLQLLDTDPAKPANGKQLQKEMKEHADKPRPGHFPFSVRRLSDDLIIGETALWNAVNQHHDTWVSVFIGDRELWSKGYGSDALKIILRYGFQELNLHRVSLGTFGYNTRAIRAYERIGFVHEGKIRSAMRRYLERGDIINMGILRTEWEAKYNGA